MANQIYTVNLTATSLDGVMSDPETKLLQDHIANGDVHVLASDKAIWNAKADVSTVASIEGGLNLLLDRLTILENQVVDLKKTDVLPVTDIENANDNTKDLVITLDAPVSGVKAIVGKSVEIKEAELTSGRFDIAATEDVTVKGFTTSGVLAKSVSNAATSINTNGYVRISDSEVGQASYNAIEIGLAANVASKSIIIDNVSFTGTLTNNTISIFDTVDGAVVNISNCNFVKCSNPIRISNRSGNKLIVNIVNCTFGEWDTGEYSGMIICQDYSSKTASEAMSNNLFSPDKVTINIINCTKGGVKIVNADPSTICGTKQDSQLLYVYYDRGGFITYDASKYPALTIK